MVNKAQSSSEQMWGMKQDTFYAILKAGAIAGVVSGVILAIGSVLTDILSGAGMFGFFSSLIKNIIQGVVFGAVAALITVKFYDKFPFKTLFMKIFGLRLVIDIVVSLLFIWSVIFFGAAAFLVLVISFVVADYVFAKIVANKVGPLTGLN